MAKAKPKKIPVARFTGPSVVERGLTKEDWARNDIDMDTVWWTPANNHTVDITDWPKEAIELLEAQEGEFEIGEADEPEPEPEDEPAPSEEEPAE